MYSFVLLTACNAVVISFLHCMLSSTIEVLSTCTCIHTCIYVHVYMCDSRVSPCYKKLADFFVSIIRSLYYIFDGVCVCLIQYTVLKQLLIHQGESG